MTDYLEMAKRVKSSAKEAKKEKKVPFADDPLSTLDWSEDEAYQLIRKALVYVNEQHQKAGKPAFDLAALDDAGDRIDEAYVAEDMAALRRAVRAFAEAGLEEFRVAALC